MAIYRRFLKGVPGYLARHYWWAYLWRVGVRFFDHQPVINAILFGQYQRLMTATLAWYRPRSGQRALQLTCVYGKLTPELLALSPEGLHLADVADIQLRLARAKTMAAKSPLYPVRMNAESLAYRDDAFDVVVLFFLLHEMPEDARIRTLSEMLRVVRPGGRILITEYGQRPVDHFLYRLLPLRCILTRLEPFLAGFWQENLDALLADLAGSMGKEVRAVARPGRIFSGFYQVRVFEVGQPERKG